MGWLKVPEFESVSSTDDNPFAGSRVQPAGKVSVKLPVDDWLCRKMEKLYLTITEGYRARNTETAGRLKDQFIKHLEVRRGILLASLTDDRVVFTLMLPVTSLLINRDQKSGNPAWKQIRDRQQGKKGRGKPSTFSQKPAKGSKPRK